MKTKLLRQSLLIAGLLIAAILFLSPRAQSYSTGAPGSSTGSPGDISTCIQCHGAQVTDKPGWLTSDIPASGFQYSTTYTITASATHAGAVKIGFQACAENPAEQKVGTIVVTDAMRTQIMSTYYITHTSAGTAPTNDANSWSFNWTSPADATPYVTIYACFNAANGNGMATGDRLYTSKLTLFHASTAGMGNHSDASFSVFPNPASDYLFVEPGVDGSFGYRIIDLGGRTIIQGQTEGTCSIDVSDLTPGIYVINAMTENGSHSCQFLKQ